MCVRLLFRFFSNALGDIAVGFSPRAFEDAGNFLHIFVVFLLKKHILKRNFKTKKAFHIQSR